MDHVQEAHDGERAGGARELIDRATTRRTAVLGARRLCARRRVTRVSEKMEKNQKKKEEEERSSEKKHAVPLSYLLCRRRYMYCPREQSSARGRDLGASRLEVALGIQRRIDGGSRRANLAFQSRRIERSRRGIR